MTNTNTDMRQEKSWFSEWAAVLAVFVISMIAAGLAWQYEKARVHQDGQLQFETESHDLRDEILDTVKAYAQFLRGGVGFVHASGNVSRMAWHQYVQDARLSENYPGIQGVSINGFVTTQTERDALLSRLRTGDWPEFQIKPDGLRDTYAPVLFLEPLNARNERAIGFDIYSEPLRRAAVDRSVEEGEPALTAKITLVQEDPEGGPGKVQAGVLLILPTYNIGTDPLSASERRAQTNGLIVSVFRMGDLVRSVIENRGEVANKRVRLNLYDAATARDAAQLYGDTYYQDLKPRTALFSDRTSIELYGRVWTFETFSAEMFETEVAKNSPDVVLGTGVLLALLLTSLVFGQSQRAHETQRAAEKLTANQDHIKLLMGEVNHRSKNLLSLVQAIARQTKSDDPDQFVLQFSERVRALAASQDLLVKNSWKGISLNELIDSQLAHFEGLLGNRIQINGPKIDMTAEASQTLGMAFHELATNAGKYGALSNASGTVDIRWDVVREADADDRLEVSWLESGGPLVKEPLRKGFGFKVTDMMVKYALGGEVDSAFEPTGFSWRLICPVSRILETGTLHEGSTPLLQRQST